MIKKGITLMATKEGRKLVKGFYEKGKGYIRKRKPTKETRAANKERDLQSKRALKKFGITSHHRKSFKPVHKILSR